MQNEVQVPPPDNSSKWALLIIVLLFILVGIVGSSCSTVKHKQAKLSAQFDKLKSKADADPTLATIPPQKCASWYVPIEKTKETFKYLPGKPYAMPGKTVYRDYNCDSAIKAQKLAGRGGEKIRVEVPVYVQVDTAAIQMETVRENVAGLAYRDSVIEEQKRTISDKDAQLKTAYVDNKKLEDSRGWWRGKALWTWGIDTTVLALMAFLWYQRRKVSLLNEVRRAV
jgi:hypothetical protein